ncbi:VOC family protein [Neotabrizicola sp. sgz301269]|uniref:VOC family protein n=1 Tax=Neotabrizicola sp. sgz301269 TaxID=3276282 RepID=UPI00376F86DE
MTHPIRTVLWFNGRGREAAEFYCSLIPDSRIESGFASDKGGPDGKSHFEVINLLLGGVPYQILDAGPMFPLSECVSVMIETADQAETDRLWTALVEGGGSHGPCGWLKDRFGLSWQVVPRQISAMLAGPNADRAIAAVMTMGKIDLQAVIAATRAAA